MIKRLPKEKRRSQKKKFHKVRPKLTKADKTKEVRELARNLPKKNAQEPAQKNAQEGRKKEKICTKNTKHSSCAKVNSPPSISRKKLSGLLCQQLDSKGIVSPLCLVVPRKKMSGFSCKKSYKVLHVDVERLTDTELLILKREAELSGVKKPNEVLFDADDDDAEEEVRKKQSKEKEFYTVVWLLVGGDDNFECQWVNAEDVYFL